MRLKPQDCQESELACATEWQSPKNWLIKINIWIKKNNAKTKENAEKEYFFFTIIKEG